MIKSYLEEFKRGDIVPVFLQFELQQKKQRILKRKAEICSEFHKSVATAMMEAML